MRNPIRIQSVNTKYFIVSTKEDKPGQKVVAKPGSGDNPPENSIVFSDVVIVDGANVAVIVGVSGLYIALKGDAELIWSDKPEDASWVVNRTSNDSYVISPANGADLFWVDEFNVEYVEVRRGSNIRPPENEWLIFSAEEA